jgi:NADH-quinone oxidoreductase subunit G
LIEPAPQASSKYFTRVPKAFAPSRDDWLLVPLYHVFGSEELSLSSPGIAELTPKPYVALNAEDAKRLRVDGGEQIKIELEGAAYRLPVKIKAELPLGIAGLPVGLPGLAGINLPVRSVLQREDKPLHTS